MATLETLSKFLGCPLALLGCFSRDCDARGHSRDVELGWQTEEYVSILVSRAQQYLPDQR